jgi:hypothetical protein
MLPLERLTAWSRRRQLLDGRGASALEALRTIVAVYSTHPTAPLALLARSSRLDASQFRALDQQRQAVRIAGMRGSFFMVPTPDASRVFSATRIPLDKLGGTLRYAGLDLETYSRLVPRVLECCGVPLTRSELRACLPDPEDVYMVARILARQGQVLRVGGSLRTDQLKWVATSAWLGEDFEDIDRSAALTWLAEVYLRAFGPARVADFAWWSGATRRAASAAVSALATCEIDGLLLLVQDADAFNAVQPLEPDCLDVLPKWDSYTMGYAPDGRQRFIDDRFLSLAYTQVAGSPGATSGDGLPLILRGGRAMATWSHRFAGNQLQLVVAPFESPAADVPEDAFVGVAGLLGATSVTTEPLNCAR